MFIEYKIAWALNPNHLHNVALPTVVTKYIGFFSPRELLAGWNCFDG